MNEARVNDPAEIDDGRELEPIEVEPEALCINCGHTKEAHWDRYGCQVEGPDRLVSGTNCDALMAAGPCGCKNFQAEEARPVAWPSPLLYHRKPLDVSFDELETP